MLWRGTEIPAIAGGPRTIVDNPNVHISLHYLPANLAANWGFVKNPQRAFHPYSNCAMFFRFGKCTYPACGLEFDINHYQIMHYD
jgi:hypothetical protein